MLDQLVLATQLALENVDNNEVKSVMDNVYVRNVSHQSDQVNSMINHEGINVLLSGE